MAEKGKEELSRIALVVITLNEEADIRDCILSAGEVGEVIVVDSFSTDRTVDIAKELGAEVYQRKFTNHADQKNWAISKVSKDWTLVLDADERVTPSLRAEISRRIGEPGIDGYWIRRKSEFLGSMIRFCGWNRDRVLRLFKSGRGSYPEREVHEKLELDGRAASLSGLIHHRPYRDMSDYAAKMHIYSRAGALELSKKGRRWFPSILLNPPARFIRMYILQGGFLDGAAGFVLCSLAAASVFFKYAYLRDLKGNKNALK